MSIYFSLEITVSRFSQEVPFLTRNEDETGTHTWLFSSSLSLSLPFNWLKKLDSSDSVCFDSVCSPPLGMHAVFTKNITVVSSIYINLIWHSYLPKSKLRKIKQYSSSLKLFSFLYILLSENKKQKWKTG